MQEQDNRAGKGGLLASTLVVSTMTMLSRVLGLVRDIVLARLLGASAGTDAFFVAFRIPNFLRRLFAEGAFNQAFVPVLSEYRNAGSLAATRLLIDRVAGTLGGTLMMIVFIGVLASPLLIWVFAPGFGNDPHKRHLAVEMLRLTFPYLFFIALTAFAGSILNTWSRFAVPAFTPVLLNLSLIGSALFLAPHFAEGRMAVALAWGVLIAGVVQLTFQLPFLARLHLLPVPRMAWNDPGVRRILRLMLPALFGVSVSQINLLLDTVLASMLPTGSVTWLYYSDRLNELPLGVFAIAIGTVILPNLSGKHASASVEAFSRTLDWGLRLVLLIGIPSALALALIAEPLLSTLFHHGEFTAYDVIRSAQSLRAYSVGLVAFMLIKILAPGYFARQDTKTPVKIGIIAMVSNMVLNLILVWPLQHAGLALATSLAAWLNAGLLYLGLRRGDVYRPGNGWGRHWLRLLAAGAGMGAVVFALARHAAVWLHGGLEQRILWLTVIILSGLAVYALILLILGLRPRHLRR